MIYNSDAVAELISTQGLNLALTGGPSVGKTTLANWLASVGFTVVPEMPSILLAEANKFLRENNLSAGPELAELFAGQGLFHPMVDNPAFQAHLLERQLTQEQPHIDRTPPAAVCFDRTYLDVLPYCQYFGIAPPDRFHAVLPPPAKRYDVCFLLESLNAFVDNGMRLEKVDEGDKFAHLIAPRLAETYRAHGVPPIHVPKMSIEERQDFVWDHIDSYAKSRLTRTTAAA